jgi:hypothetical protein
LWADHPRRGQSTWSPRWEFSSASVSRSSSFPSETSRKNSGGLCHAQSGARAGGSAGGGASSPAICGRPLATRPRAVVFPDPFGPSHTLRPASSRYARLSGAGLSKTTPVRRAWWRSRLRAWDTCHVYHGSQYRSEGIRAVGRLSVRGQRGPCRSSGSAEHVAAQRGLAAFYYDKRLSDVQQRRSRAGAHA